MSATSVSSARRAATRRTAPRRAEAARVPRRVSGPVGGRPAARPAPQQSPTVGARALALVRSLPDHSVIERLVRGRAWIPVLGVLLAGIVAMQVEILKLGTNLGRSLAQTTTLQSQNESLQARVATLADDQRIERLATAMGMQMPSAGLLTFVPARPGGQLGKALANLHSPDPGNFSTQLAAQIASDALIAPAAPATTAAPTGQTSAATPSAGSTAATSGTTTTQSTGGTPGTSSGTGAATGAAGTVPTVSSTGTQPAGTTQTTTATTSTGAAATTPTGAAGLSPTSTSSSGTSTGG